MLEVKIENKKYQNKTILEDIHLKINQNGLYGILGKNGSGKTTFFKCLTNLEKFDGVIKLNDKPLLPENIGFFPTEPYLYEHLTAKEFYTFYKFAMNISQKAPLPFAIDEHLLIKELSTGMRKKVYFNAVFQKTYDLYIFDEPFNGLDIESVYLIRKIIDQLSENHIVFMSSHIWQTFSKCKEIYMIKGGNLQRIPPETNLNNIEDLLLSD